ncbi:MAG: dihydrofolate reductase [Bacteroidia bacterium]
MKKILLQASVLALISTTFIACNNTPKTNEHEASTTDTTFEVGAEQFADLQLLRYQVPGFEQLSVQQKTLLYYLYEAALSGRDIAYDQEGKYGIMMRKTIEAIYNSPNVKREGEEWDKFHEYAGRFFFSNGNHHHYASEKFVPTCSFDYFASLVKSADAKLLPLDANEDVTAFVTRIKPTFFDANFEPKITNLDAGIDNVVASSNHFYENVTQKEVEQFYAGFDTKGNAPSWGLNSTLTKADGKITERTWKVGGMYTKAIEKIVTWLKLATTVAENEHQKQTLEKLIKYYETGDLKAWDDYNISWVNDTASSVDVVNGFIEVYADAIGKKGSWESCVSFKDIEATKRIKAIAAEAQWFEDNSPLLPEHKKKQVKGITAKVITVVVEAGDAAPSTPIGINLPNAEWIRKEHGSKSVSLGNIVSAYNLMTAKKGTLDEFGLNDEVKARIKQYGALSSDLHTDMHECIGHASGQINPGIDTPDKTLKNYASCLEEARADLVALYYVLDQKLIDMKVMPSLEVGKAEYDSYIMGGLITQLTRLELGKNIEEAHMRNRQLNAKWVYEKGKKDNVIEFVKKDGKTFVQINDYNKLRTLFGDLLREIQRIKSEGDYKAATALVEGYGVKVDKVLHAEVLERFSKLGVKPYRGFIQPKLTPVMNGDKIIDVKVEYPASFYQQMLEYGAKYSFLPTVN